jgi:hypothetical protein
MKMKLHFYLYTFWSGKKEMRAGVGGESNGVFLC